MTWAAASADRPSIDPMTLTMPSMACTVAIAAGSIVSPMAVAMASTRRLGAGRFDRDDTGAGVHDGDAESGAQRRDAGQRQREGAAAQDHLAAIRRHHGIGGRPDADAAAQHTQRRQRRRLRSSGTELTRQVVVQRLKRRLEFSLGDRGAGKG